MQDHHNFSSPKFPPLPSVLPLPKQLPDMETQPSSSSAQHASSSFLHELETLIDANAQVLQDLEAQSQKVSEVYTDLRTQVDHLPTGVKFSVSGGITQPSQVFDPTSQFTLQLVDFPHTPLYSRRKFDIAFKLIDRNGETVHLDKPLFCYISILQMSPDAEEVRCARDGELYVGRPFLKGQVAKVFHNEEVMRMSGLVFTDISSLFPQGRVNILIRCADNEVVKPIFIEGVRVKARKKRPDEVI